MADSTLQSLLSTKAALDLGLITQADFDVVKNSFLRAQQIKSAVDVGLIKAEDYEDAKQNFLGSLVGGAPAAPQQQQQQQPAAPAAEAAPPPAPRPPPVAWQLPPPSPKLSPRASEAGNGAAPQPAAKAAPRSEAPTIRKSASTSNVPTRVAGNVPTNIPKMSGAKAVAQGKSMSGITVTEDAVNLFYLMRLKATYKWALWQVDDSGSRVIIAAVGEKGSSWDDFLAALPDSDCRYGVYDFDFTTPDGQTLHKMIFLNWAPDSARVKAKMMFASTKDFFKSHLDGISLEFQASDLEEISEQEVGDAVRALKRG